MNEQVQNASCVDKPALGVTESATPAKELKEMEEEVADSKYPHGIKLIIIMASLMLGTTLMALDSTIISVATPRISTQFQALSDVGWYGAAYSMILTATTPIFANFYKYFQPKSIYLASITVFEGRPQSCSASSRTLMLCSGICCVCCSTYFVRFHYWKSYCRPRSCRPASRSIRHSHVRMSTRDATFVSRISGQSLRLILKPWACYRGSFDRACHLEMVFLDVNFPNLPSFR